MIARITQAWRATASKGKPLCVVLQTNASARNVVVDLFFTEEGDLAGAKVYDSPQTVMMEMGRTA